MNSFYTEKFLERHSEYCLQYVFVKTVVPRKEIELEDGTKKEVPRFLRFNNYL